MRHCQTAFGSCPSKNQNIPKTRTYVPEMVPAGLSPYSPSDNGRARGSDDDLSGAVSLSRAWVSGVAAVEPSPRSRDDGRLSVFGQSGSEAPLNEGGVFRMNKE